MTVRGDVGLCFSERFRGQQVVRYRATLRSSSINSKMLRVIPLVAKSAKVTVDVRSTNGLERDTVERTLHVVVSSPSLYLSLCFCVSACLSDCVLFRGVAARVIKCVPVVNIAAAVAAAALVILPPQAKCQSVKGSSNFKNNVYGHE